MLLLLPPDGGSWIAFSLGVGVTAVGAWLLNRRAHSQRGLSAGSELLLYFENAFRESPDGVLICDNKGVITSANDAFLKLTGENQSSLIQSKLRDLPWNWADQQKPGTYSDPIPWVEAIRNGKDRCGRILGLKQQSESTLLLRAVPIQLEGEPPRGALCLLQDVTRLQKKELETQALLKTIRDSSLQIRQQNAEIDELLIRDPMTGCLNRRAGLEALERLWESAQKHDDPLACAIINIDHFRVINESCGRIAAQKVLREVAYCLRENCRSSDVLFRSGGEEFLYLMPQTTLTDATYLAERMRQSVVRLQSCDTAVTVSVGVATSDAGQRYPQDLVDLAERHLRIAKDRGRNQVINDQSSPDAASLVPLAPAESSTPVSTIIPFPAVSALMSALAYRDPATAAHSRRVADLSVAIGHRLMSLRSSYLLEMASLLHDIGKIGVPDSLLHKQTKLSAEEHSEIQAYRRMGVEIVRSAFGSSELTSILENYGIPFEVNQQQGETIPLGARILAVSDAYDSMVSAQTYRQPLSREEAIEELKRCAGTQFDPEIVAQLIEVLKSGAEEAPQFLEVDREVAFALGMHLECLVDALDRQDFESLRITAHRLAQTSRQSTMNEITDRADELVRMASGESDQLGILQKANALMNCCRAAQSASLMIETARFQSHDSTEEKSRLTESK